MADATSDETGTGEGGDWIDHPFGVNAQVPRRPSADFPFVAESDLPYENLRRAWELMLGASQWVRIGQWADRTSWDNVEIEMGRLHLDPDVEKAIAQAAERGLRVQVTLCYGNPLYCGPSYRAPRIVPNVWDGRRSCFWAPLTSDAIDAFAAYCAYMVRRLGGWVKDWEIWNEENLASATGSYFWASERDPTAYTRLFKAAAQRIKEVDPEARVAFGGVAGIDMAYLEESLQQGAGEYVDVIPIHPYRAPNSAGCLGTPEGPSGPPGGASPYTAYREDIERLRELVARYAPGAMVWANETGWPVPPAAPDLRLSIPAFWDCPVGELTQAKYLARAYLQNLALGIPTAWWWLLNASRVGAFGVRAAPDEALLRDDLSPRPAFHTLAALGATFGRRVRPAPLATIAAIHDAPAALHAYAFERGDGRHVLALWLAEVGQDNSPMCPLTLTMREPLPAHVTIAHLVGDTTPQSGLALHDARMLELEVGDAPLLVYP